MQASGVVKLVDFGIAMEADSSTLTEQGQAFGSVCYAPPEWLDPQSLDPVKWDMYAAGIVFYELLTGRQAFPATGDGTMQQQVMRMISVKQRHPPLDPGPGVPRGLRSLIREMTHPQPASRLADAAAVCARLAAVDLTDLSAPADADSTWHPEPAPQSPSPAGATMIPGFDGFAPRTPTRPDPQLQHLERLSPKRAARPTAVLAGIGVGAAILAGAASLAGFAAYTLVPPDTREVRVTVLGPSPSDTVALTLGGREGTLDGTTWIFAEVPVGDAELRVTHGPGGQPCTADAPWCLRSLSAVPVRASREVLPWSITLAPLVDRGIRVVAAALPQETALTLTVGPLSTTGSASGVALALAPGRHAATVTCAICEPWQGELVVPVGDGTLDLPITVTPKAAEPAPARPGRPVEARVSAGGGRVTNKAFARWLTTHPDWAPTAARASGRADARYLARWKDDAPPAGKDSAAATDVSWAAADAYCASRGGLAPLDAPPLKWAESEPWLEFRVADGTPAWRRNDGGESRAVRRSETGVLAGFRCAK